MSTALPGLEAGPFLSLLTLPGCPEKVRHSGQQVREGQTGTDRMVMHKDTGKRRGRQGAWEGDR